MLELQMACNIWLINNDFLVLEKKKKSPDRKDEVDNSQPSYEWNKEKASTLMSLGCKNILKQIDKLLPEYNERKSSIREQNALTEKSGKIIYENLEKGIMAFSPAGLANIRKELNELHKEQVTIYTRVQDQTKVDIFNFSIFMDILVPKEKGDWEFDDETDSTTE